MAADIGPFPSPAAPPPPRGRSSNGVVIIVAIVIALAILAGVTALAFVVKESRAARAHATPTPTPAPITRDITSTSGAVVFSDDFHDPASGWSTTTLPSGSSFSYRGGKYVVFAKGTLHHYADSPYAQPHQQLSASVIATQSAGASVGAGFGVTFRRGSGAAEVRYEFVVLVGGEFFIEAGTGPDTATNAPVVVKQGTSPSAPGATPMTVAGACMTSTDGRATRLVLFVNGANLADITETQTLAGNGWVAGIDIASRDTSPSTVTITRFDERDLGG
jgi:hypothetical protein